MFPAVFSGSGRIRAVIRGFPEREMEEEDLTHNLLCGGDSRPGVTTVRLGHDLSILEVPAVSATSQVNAMRLWDRD